MKQLIKYLFVIFLNIICALGFLFSLTEAIIGNNPYKNMLWMFAAFVLFGCVLYLNQNFTNKLTKF